MNTEPKDHIKWGDHIETTFYLKGKQVSRDIYFATKLTELVELLKTSKVSVDELLKRDFS